MSGPVFGAMSGGIPLSFPNERIADSEVSGYGCADVDLLVLPPLEDRVDLAAVADWTAANDRARDEYRRCPSQYGRWGKR